jgi:hypothetical protein
MSSVRQNLGLIIVPNAIAIALGAFGFISPSIAAIINNGATLLAVLVGTTPLLETPARNPRPEFEGEATSTARDPPPSTIASRDPPGLLTASGRG